MPTPTVEEIKPVYQNERFLEEKNQDYSSNIGLYKVQIGEVVPKQSIIKRNSESGPYSERVIPNVIKERIEESKKILLLDANWDDCGALAVNEVAYRNAINFLEKYSERILDVFFKDLIPPAIVAVKDGSVDLEWNLENSYLLINFKNDDPDNALYYLAFKKENDIIYDANGQIKIEHVNDKFASNLVDLS